MAKPATDKQTGLRKLPTQARSRARVESILKAAAAALGEVGYDGVSTNLIAERADIPVDQGRYRSRARAAVSGPHSPPGERAAGCGLCRASPQGLYRAAGRRHCRHSG